MPNMLSYVPGAVQAQTEGPGYGYGPAAAQAPSGVDIGALMAWRQAQADRQRERAMMDAANAREGARQEAESAYQRNYLASREDRDFDRQMKALQLQAMQEQMRGAPQYGKIMSSFNASGGYAGASPGQQGAVFMGYAPRGSMPERSEFTGPYTHVPTGSIATPDLAGEEGAMNLQERYQQRQRGAAGAEGPTFDQQRMQRALEQSNQEWEQRQRAGGAMTLPGQYSSGRG